MTEGKALAVTFTVGMVLWTVICGALMLLGASPELIFLAMMAALGALVYATSSIILRYGKNRRDR